MNAVWNLIARLCAKPSVMRLLVKQAQKRPHLHIGDYMHRWWLIPPSWRLPFSIRIHHILRPDADPYLHDHPWNWRAIILKGWYSEEDVEGKFIERHAGSTRGCAAETLHRIDMVSDGGAWTLFIMGKRRNRWGFMVGSPSRKVYWRDYVSTNDRGELSGEMAGDVI